MSDDSDDPVMALLATQRAVLAAVENLAGQVEAMQGKVDAMSGVLAQLVAGSVGEAAPAAKGGADRRPTLGDRFRAATTEEAVRDPALQNAQSQYLVARAIANANGILRKLQLLVHNLSSKNKSCKKIQNVFHPAIRKFPLHAVNWYDQFPNPSSIRTNHASVK